MNMPTDLVIRGDGALVMVDDDPIDTLMVARCHERSIIQQPFIAFQDGQSFLRYLDEAFTEGALPSLVLLDINMPTMSGFEVMETMRANHAFSDIPVALFYSNSDNPADRERAATYHTRVQEKFSSVANCVAFLNSLADSGVSAP